MPSPLTGNRKFLTVMVAVLVAIFGTGVALYEYQATTFVHMQVMSSPHAYFVVAHGSASVTIPKGQNATVELPPNTEILVQVYPDSPYAVSGWTVSGAQVVSQDGGELDVMTGNGGQVFRVAVTLTNSTGR